MARINRDSLDKFFDYHIWLEGRTIYIGAQQIHATDGYDEYSADEISPFTAEQVIKQLKILDSQQVDKPIQIILNSPGGDIYQGLAIYDAITACVSEVEILATGQCMSAASVILQAGDIRRATPNCVIMVHDGQDDNSGSPRTVYNWAKFGKQINKLMYQIYAHRSNKSEGYWQKRCAEDFIMLASEALEEGLIDEII